MASLRAAGDASNAEAELTRLCVRPTAEFQAECASRAGAAAWREAEALWPRYEALRLVIPTRAELTRAGVDRAAAPKRALLQQLAAVFARAVASGDPEWLAAATFQSGLAQWHYGLFLRDVSLPAELTEAQRTAAQRGSAQQAEVYFDAGLAVWQALVDKAAADGFTNAWVSKAKAAVAGAGVPPRTLAPPTTADSTKPPEGL
ncbi:MAG: hypothetical protein K2X99_10780 [Gemmatimonadaceae bacterium]|nr:hypothetical protein [Gemmatimonadaceae bacterium]